MIDFLKSRIPLVLWFISAFIIVIGIVCSIFGGEINISLFALFSIPVVIGLFGWAFVEYEAYKRKKIHKEIFRGFYNFSMFFSICSYGMMWIIYIVIEMNNWGSVQLRLNILPFFYVILNILSFFCVILILMHVLLALFVTYVIMEPKHYKKITSLVSFKNGLLEFPFWRFAHFFSIFLCVSFLFGFGFAFHDLGYIKPVEIKKYQEDVEKKKQDKKNAKEGIKVKKIEKSLEEQVEDVKFDSAIYVEEMKPKNPKVESGENEPTKSKQKRTSNEEKKTSESKEKEVNTNQLLGCFYFESGKANFTSNDRTKILKGHLKDDDTRRFFLREDNNFKQMQSLISKLKKIEKEGILQITLIGRADDTKSSSKYPSNYELSEARMNIVKSKIKSEFFRANDKTWKQIDWSMIALSNETSTHINEENTSSKEFKGNCKPLEKDKDSERRVVEVNLDTVSPDSETNETNSLHKLQIDEYKKNNHKKPTLMEYMYFPLSKGYGDIKPISNYAKFLDTLDSLFDIFFLVCFMNALIALKPNT